VDRSQPGTERKRPNRPPAQHYGAEPGNNRYYGDRFQRDFSSQYNLVYHLYGPDHYRPYGQRYWLSYRRQWGQLPWYGRNPVYDSWWYDPYWSWEYRWNSYAWDPWFDHFYDPWYWDPYGGGYGLGYASYGGYYDYWPYGYIRRGTLATVAIKPANHQQRRRGRKDLPTTMSAGKSRAAGPSSTQIRVGRSPGRTTTTGAVSVRRQGRSSSASSKDKSGGSRQARTRKRKD
ncbi:MAG: hypothetical protein IIB42_09105, partial [Candidatus Marinimicrobia bacterium]|nr:hypothetical protein [Candidatus Neomarinimicrobiota bacterium]